MKKFKFVKPKNTNEKTLDFINLILEILKLKLIIKILELLDK